MPRIKLPALIALLLVGAAASVWCHAEEAKRPAKKRPVAPQTVAKPAAQTGQPNSAKNTGPAKPVAATAPAGTPVTSPTNKPGPVVNEPVSLGGEKEGKTINFSSGKPVVTDTPEDKVAINSALKDFSEASKGVTFGPTKKKKPAPPKN